MTRRLNRRTGLAALAVVAALLAWLAVGRLREPARSSSAPAPAPAASTTRSTDRAPGQRQASRPRAPRLPFAAPGGESIVTLSGRVIDIREQHPVGGVEVVFRGAAGEAASTTGGDGEYTIQLAPGSYRAYVRDDTVLSIGRSDRVRLPGPPSSDTAGVPDEALMATVVATGDADGVDLSVVRGGVVAGVVVDRSGRPIPGAVVRARSGSTRPTLGTDVAESDVDGSFELRLPAGAFDLEGSHPRFAGVADATEARIVVEPGSHLRATVALTAGCVIAGRVIGADGKPAGDGAIERQFGSLANEFGPAGRIEADGRFSWVTTEPGNVTIRAWPWKSPPSPARVFSCRDGARWSDVVFQLPDRHPDLEGVVVDPAGQPVGFTFVDLAPLDRGGIAQQERSDGDGHWAVYDLPPGRYRVTAQADGRGVTSANIVSPRDGVRLELGGTGRLEGTTARLASGSFELMLGACLDAAGKMAVPQARQLVTITGGRFAIDGLPACQLVFNAVWHGRAVSQQVAIPAGGTAHIDLDLGPPRPKTVQGTVRDSAGQTLAGALVTASHDGNTDASTKTNAAGDYTLKTISGASLRATLRGHVGFAQVGGADIDGERVDLVLDDADTGDRSN
jgi:hypothetical protein